MEPVARDDVADLQVQDKVGFPDKTCVRELTSHVGAEITGLDLKLDRSEAVIGAIRRAVTQYKVVAIRGQDLSVPEFRDFGACFGESVEYPFSKGLDHYPEVFEILKDVHHTDNFGGGWHTDSPFLEAPPHFTLLIARECPEVGGDTLFSNSERAWQTLSAGMQRLLFGLNAVFSASLDSSGGRANRHQGYDHMSLTDLDRAAEYEACHPVVRIHPETAEPSLFVSEAHMTQFEGFSREESRALLAYLFEHAARPEFTARLTWEPGTLAIFDNTCLQHFALNDYNGSRRRMHRMIVDPVIPKTFSR